MLGGVFCDVSGKDILYEVEEDLFCVYDLMVDIIMMLI